ncbi:hypothetical protein FRZ67_02030 [Panacibacter ginsenosidivorans]|uniref:Uncharacterized protein n=1 Tax=Panacibacter ginsenosidivorans TaxID=1813871 RepID=A0A5B8V5W6_9BACT|nr:hypothetical protein [Panacibacter ginsenosidivorans]QEC66141.1 hypothetical protein FRZ67_02030 [Panacibacter ginsenosidivorans]
MNLKRYKYKKATILIAIAGLISVLCIQAKSWSVTEKPVVKKFNLEVYKSNDYLSAIYNDATAKVSISITKVSRHSRTTIWNKTFDALQLKQYPLSEDALFQRVVINNVFDSKEHLEIHSTVSYYANGGILEIEDGVLVSKGATDSTLIIPL